MQEAIQTPLINYTITEKPQDRFGDRVDALDLNFAPKLREKHNARKEWVYEGTVYFVVCFSLDISRIPGIFFQDDYQRELGIDPRTQLISIYRNPYSYEIHSLPFLTSC